MCQADPGPAGQGILKETVIASLFNMEPGFSFKKLLIQRRVFSKEIGGKHAVSCLLEPDVPILTAGYQRSLPAAFVLLF